MVTEPSGMNDVREVVISPNELAAKAHKALYSFPDDQYIVSGTDLLASILSAAERGGDRLHLSADWENLLRIALWSPARPPLFDVMTLLKKSGVTETDLMPFMKADINDLFPWLYYGRKFDIMRRLCHAAKTRAEARVNRKGLHIYCHLVSDESRSIVASSL